MKVIRITGGVNPDVDIKPWCAFQALKETDEENVFRAGALVLEWFNLKEIDYEVIVEEDLDLDALVTFFDPHSGLGGAILPLSQSVKKIVGELDGQTFSLRQAVEMLQQAAPWGSVELNEGSEYIRLRISNCSWKLVCYKSV